MMSRSLSVIAIAVAALSGAAAPAFAAHGTTRSLVRQVRALRSQVAALNARVRALTPQARPAAAAAAVTPSYAFLDAANPWQVGQTFPSLGVAPQGTVLSSTSSGGALMIDSSASSGAGAVLYTDAGAEATGRLMNLRVDNPAFAPAGLHVDYSGTGNPVEVASTSPNPSSVAVNVTSASTGATALGVKAPTTGKGVVKITHTGATGDANGSALSLLLTGAGSAAQGIFLDAPDTTAGQLLNLRNGGVPRLTLSPAGVLYASGGLATGDSEPATAVTGPLVRRLALRDRTGQVLGWLPVYSDIR
jgi:Hyaluronidase protein (HylP)